MSRILASPVGGSNDLVGIRCDAISNIFESTEPGGEVNWLIDNL